MRALKIVTDSVGRYHNMEAVNIGANLSSYHHELRCDTIDVVSLGNNLIAIIDDNGLFNYMYATVFSVSIEGDNERRTSSPLAGNILIFGVNAAGDTIDIPDGVRVDIHAMAASAQILADGPIDLVNEEGKVIQTVNVKKEEVKDDND